MKIGKYLKYCLVIIISMAIAYQIALPTKASSTTTVYETSDENFPNPERGFFAASNPTAINSQEQTSPLKLSDLQKNRSENITLVRRYYLIDEFRNKLISQSFLDMISNDCEIARQAGIKLIPRFAYNWANGGSDADKNTVLSHLDQLKPIFATNFDVIAYMEAGFIGYWGEWHSSTNGLDSNSNDRREILLKILSVLPDKRMVALRYPHYKRDAFKNENALTPEEAFNGSQRARVGAHNDCFLADINDGGTYNSEDKAIIDQQKNFLNLDNKYVVQGGEICTFTGNTSEYDNCPNALKELERMHWSALNADVFEKNGKEILDKWKAQGCLEEIKQRLGYRFRLLKSVTSEKVKAGGIFKAKIEVTNDGWASPYNQRNVEVILHNIQTKKEYYLSLDEDPRMWMSGDKTVNILGGIPENMPLGEYQVLLNLADANAKLSNRPEYSIRFANKNVWNKTTGYNSLLHSVIVEPNPEESNYFGDRFFVPRIQNSK